MYRPESRISFPSGHRSHPSGVENGLPVSNVMDAVKGPLVIKLDGMKKAEE
jgi:hypothetical protein